MPAREQAQPEILCDVRVLILVHQNIAEPALVLIEHIVMCLENRHNMQQQIAEIHGVEFQKTLLIHRVELGATIVERTCICTWHLFGCQRSVFPAINKARKHTRRPAFIVYAFSAQKLFQEANLIICIKDREIALKPHQFRVSAQQLHTNRMESAKPRHPLDRLTKHTAHAIFHLARSFVGEGDRQNLVGTRFGRVHQMNNARGQCFGFACTRTRQHQNWTVQCFHCFALRGIQPI